MKYCHLCEDTCTKRRLDEVPALNRAPAEDYALGRIAELIGSTSRILSTEGLVCLDLADLRSGLSGAGLAVMGIGEASGEGRAIRAAEAAIADLKAQLYAAGLGAGAASRRRRS